MKKTAIILCLLTLLTACVFNIKLPPEEKSQSSLPTENEVNCDEQS